MIYVLQLEQQKFWVGRTDRQITEHFIDNFHYESSKWTTVYRPLRVIELHDDNGIAEENDITLRVMDKYGWWNVRGGIWSHFKLPKCPTALVQLQQQNSQESPGSSMGQCVTFNSQLRYFRHINDSNITFVSGNNGDTTTAATSTVGSSSDLPLRRSISAGLPSAHINKHPIANNSYGSGNESDSGYHSTSSQSLVSLKSYRDNGTCFKCGRNSHFANDCFAKYRVDGTRINNNHFIQHDELHSNQIYESAVSGDEYDDVEVVCFRCGRSTHTASDCFAKTHAEGHILKRSHND